MKKTIFILLLCLLGISVSGWSQETAPAEDSAAQTAITDSSKNVAAPAAAPPPARNNRETAAAPDNKPCNCIPKPVPGWENFGTWLLVFMPLFVFIMIIALTRKTFKDFNIKDALAENTGSRITVHNPEYNAANIGLPPSPNAPLPTATLANLSTLVPPTIDVTPFTQSNIDGVVTKTPAPDYRTSSSRLIALLSIMVIIIITVTMSCLFIYRYLSTGCPPDFSNLTGLLVALGAGMVPYVANKVTGAVSSNGSDSL